MEVYSTFVNNFKRYDIDVVLPSHLLEVDVQYPEQLHKLHNDQPEAMKIEKVEKHVALLIYMIKVDMLFT